MLQELFQLENHDVLISICVCLRSADSELALVCRISRECDVFLPFAGPEMLAEDPLEIPVLPERTIFYIFVSSNKKCGKYDYIRI